MIKSKLMTLSAVTAMSCLAMPTMAFANGTAWGNGTAQAHTSAHTGYYVPHGTYPQVTPRRRTVEVHRGQPRRLNYNAIAQLQATRQAQEQAKAQERLAYQALKQRNSESVRANRRDSRALDVEERFLTDTRNQNIRAYYNGSWSGR